MRKFIISYYGDGKPKCVEVVYYNEPFKNLQELITNIKDISNENEVTIMGVYEIK